MPKSGASLASGSLKLNRPLLFAHSVGEPVILLASAVVDTNPPTTVGSLSAAAATRLVPLVICTRRYVPYRLRRTRCVTALPPRQAGSSGGGLMANAWTCSKE